MAHFSSMSAWDCAKYSKVSSKVTHVTNQILNIEERILSFVW